MRAPEPGEHGYADRRFSFMPESGEAPRGDQAGPQRRGSGAGPGGPAGRGRTTGGVAASGGRGGARPRGGGRSGADWESLSDVDYWAELASDKSLTTTAQPAGAAPARPESPAVPGADLAGGRAELRDRRGRAAQSDSTAVLPSAQSVSAQADDVTALMPSGRRHSPSGPGGAPTQPAAASRRGVNGNGLDAQGLNGNGRGGHSAGGGRDLAGNGNGWAGPAGPDRGGVPGLGARRGRDAAQPGGQRPASAAPPADQGIAALTRLSTPGSGSSLPPVADDDPLTSPSFPAIRDDGRSYRGSRSEAVSGSHRMYPETGPQPIQPAQPVRPPSPSRPARPAYPAAQAGRPTATPARPSRGMATAATATGTATPRTATPVTTSPARPT